MLVFTSVRWRRVRQCLIYLLTYFCITLNTASAGDSSGLLTLNEAIARTLEKNPELQVFTLRLQAVDGLRQSADLAPAFNIEVETENVLGSGEFTGTGNSDLTLSLSSIIELGDKRRSRIAVADSKYALAQAKRQVKALDLLGQVTRRFIATLVLQEKLKVVSQAVGLAEVSFKQVSQRVDRGAAPEAERLRARSALIQARLNKKSVAAQLESRKLALATLWGAQQADFQQLLGELLRFNPVTDFEELYQRVAHTPAIQIYASQARLRDAELALARSQSSTNVQWSLGIRRLQQTDDFAMTAGVSIPLFADRRNRGAVTTANAQRQEIQHRRQAALLSLRAHLFDAWQTHRQSSAATMQLRDDVLPLLEQALIQTREAYERGRYSYVDWLIAQRELLEARLAVIDAAATALLNQALIEQLTAQPLAAKSTQFAQ